MVGVGSITEPFWTPTHSLRKKRDPPLKGEGVIDKMRVISKSIKILKEIFGIGSKV